MNAITSVVVGSRIQFTYDNDNREVVVEAIKVNRHGETYIATFDAVRGAYRSFTQNKMTNVVVVE